MSSKANLHLRPRTVSGRQSAVTLLHCYGQTFHSSISLFTLFLVRVRGELL